ncbi:fructose-1,6-bisphosphatase 1-like [Cimex lectularius]|uniref:fructose-bisphosphatase n=1 Tax=Cimex lectularius TaxID=79782 RepID=A0A8I6TF53_CIMLE|nr:fructose-1,6-bisphosphatase 1-like [Cimex lectularius]
MQLHITQKFPGVVRLKLLGQEDEQEDANSYIPLSRFINVIERAKTVSSYTFPQLMCAIQTACKSISIALRKCGISQMLTLDIDKNLKYLEINRMEKYFNELFINLISNSYTSCLIACKDNDEIIRVDHEHAGKYIVLFSTTDVSRSVDSSLCIGTTFALYRKRGSTKVEDKDVLQPGYKMIAGGYALYGISTVMVIAFEGGSVNSFTLDNSIGEFMLTEENLKIPKSGDIYSANEGNIQSWDANLVDYLDKKKSAKGLHPWSSRYIGSLVGDVHRTLKFGGVYFYPPSKENPNGKHRLIYECNPLAFVITQAGGIASNGKMPIINLVPEKINEKTPFYCGSHDDMEELLKALSP